MKQNWISTAKALLSQSVFEGINPKIHFVPAASMRFFFAQQPVFLSSPRNFLESWVVHFNETNHAT